MVVMGMMGGGWKVDLHWCVITFVVGRGSGAEANSVKCRNWRSFR